MNVAARLGEISAELNCEATIRWDPSLRRWTVVRMIELARRTTSNQELPPRRFIVLGVGATVEDAVESAARRLATL